MMNFKKVIIVTLFLLCILMIGSVSAAENINDDKVSSDVSDNTISTGHNNDYKIQSKDIKSNNLKKKMINTKKKRQFPQPKMIC